MDNSDEICQLLTEIRDLQREAAERQQRALRLSQAVTIGSAIMLPILLIALGVFILLAMQTIQVPAAP